MADHEVLALPLGELMAQARAIRDQAHGTRVTFSPKVFIPLTMLCRDKCGYCTFAQPPARIESPYLSPDQVLAIAQRGAAAGCHEALFTLGERPEDRYPVARQWLTANGYTSTVLSVFPGIREQIQDNLLRSRRIGVKHHRFRRHVENKFVLLLFH